MRRGVPLSRVAQLFGVAFRMVQYWVRRVESQRLDLVDWRDRPRDPQTPANKYRPKVEDLVPKIRADIKMHSGLQAKSLIRQILHQPDVAPLPAGRTIGRILERRGTLDGQYWVRRPVVHPQIETTQMSYVRSSQPDLLLGANADRRSCVNCVRRLFGDPRHEATWTRCAARNCVGLRSPSA